MAALVAAIHVCAGRKRVVDARDTSASTRVFDALLPAHNGLNHSTAGLH